MDCYAIKLNSNNFCTSIKQFFLIFRIQFRIYNLILQNISDHTEYSLEYWYRKKKKSIARLFSRILPSSINLEGVVAKSVLVPPCDNIGGGIYSPIRISVDIISTTARTTPYSHVHLAPRHAVHEHYPTEACKPGPRKCIYMHRGWCISSASYGMRWRCTVILLDKRHAAR